MRRAQRRPRQQLGNDAPIARSRTAATPRFLAITVFHHGTTAGAGTGPFNCVLAYGEGAGIGVMAVGACAPIGARIGGGAA